MDVICFSCIIAFLPDDGVHITKCGHTFHRHCLFNWMENTKTCPECNVMCTESDVHRLYLAFANELSESLGNLDANNERSRQIVAEQGAVLSDLKQKINKNSVDQKNLETEIANIKAKYAQEKDQQIKHLQEQIQQRKSVHKELMEAKSWGYIYKFLTGPLTNVEKELSSIKSKRVLARMIVILRRHVMTAEEKRKAFRVVLRGSQEVNVKLNSENRELLARSDIIQAVNLKHSNNSLNSQNSLDVDQSKVRQFKKGK